MDVSAVPGRSASPRAARRTWRSSLLPQLLALLQAALASGSEVSFYLRSHTIGLHRQLVQEFRELNTTQLAHPNTTFLVHALQSETMAALENLRLLNGHPDPRVRSSMDVFMVDVVYAPGLADICADLYAVMPGGRSWFQRPDGRPKIFGSELAAFTVDGRLVGLPDYVQAGVLFYRKDLMRRYGLCTCSTARCRAFPASMEECDPPDTWDEMERMARIIQDGERTRNEDFWGFLMEGKASEGLMCRIMEVFSSHADPADPAMSGLDLDPVVSPSGEVVINRNHSIRALRRMAGWLGRITPFVSRDWGATDSENTFRDGNGAFLVSWLAKRVNRLNCETCPSRGKFGVGRIPGVVPGLGRGTTGGWAYGLSRNSDNPPAAADLISYLVQPRAHIVKHTLAGLLPAMVDLMNEHRPAEICNRSCSTCAVACDVDLTGTYIVARPARALAPHYIEVSALLAGKTAEVLSGRIAPEQAALDMECGILELLHGANAQPLRCRIKNDCGPGRSRIDGRCRACPAGKFADLFTSFCVDCSTGFAAPLPGSSACQGCAPGTVADAVGAASCTNCSHGSFQRTFAQSQCSPCEPGFFQAESGRTSCAACPRGKYQDALGKDRCVDCAPDKSTLGRGAGSPAECVCLGGTYLSNATCVPCQEGMRCLGGLQPPTTEDGYFAGTRAGLPPEAFEGVATEFSVFRCLANPRACPAGPAGECAPGREGIMCFDCKPGLAPQDDGSCAECTGGDKSVLGVVVAVVVLGAGALYYGTDRHEHSLPTHSALLPVAIGSMLITSMQQFGIVGRTSVMFVDPLLQVLAFPTFVVDFDVMSADCVVALSSVAAYGLRGCGVLVIMGSVALVHAAFVLLRHRGAFRRRMHRLMFMEGTLMMVFMISSVSVSIAPLLCEPHPNGLSTVRKYGTVICHGSEDHAVMLWLGLGFLMVPLGFLAICAFAVHQFPARARQGDLHFMEAFGFLFGRFKPECYWHVLVVILRNFVVALAPMLPAAPVQIMAIFIASFMWVLLVARCSSWRSPMANAFDLVVSGFTTTFACASAFFVEAADGRGIAIFCSAIVATALVFPLCFMAYAGVALLLLRKWKPFRFFICHHKGSAGAFARYLKLCLLSAMRSGSARRRDQAAGGWLSKLWAKQDVFLDCDNLMTLDCLFDTVASSVETLLLVQSKGLLLRPWCIGEIATAYSKHVQVVRLSMPDFSEPDSEFIEHYENYADISCLGPYGINMKRISDALHWLRELECLRAPGELTAHSMAEMVRSVVALQRGPPKLLASASSMLTSLSSGAGDPEAAASKAIAGTDAFIVADQSNREAVASSLALAQMLEQALLRSGPLARPRLARPVVLPRGAPLPDHASTVIFACSTSAFLRQEFLEALVAAAVCTARAVPVVVEDSFRFPVTPEAKEEVAQFVEAAPLGRDLESPEALIGIIENLFKEIAVTFSPQFSGSSQELTLKAEDVARKILAEGTTRLKAPKAEGTTRLKAPKARQSRHYL